MLVHLRRSVVLGVVVLVLTFAYAYRRHRHLPGVLQAPGRRVDHRQRLDPHRPELVPDTKCPGHPLGSCVFQGRPDDLGPYAGSPSRPPAEGQPAEADNIPGRPTA